MVLQQKGTFCPRLWHEVFINNNGDVFSRWRIAKNVRRALSRLDGCSSVRLHRLRLLGLVPSGAWGN